MSNDKGQSIGVKFRKNDKHLTVPKYQLRDKEYSAPLILSSLETAYLFQPKHFA
ncbi:unnamed protein product [Tuber melanosporum]|uniref:(Perigord truffle) hypothetical protein n=1 Tax=Tuber melanosporum (strain Mel28) TaxID=656061 RepID=D5GDY9_TUBMM|nr:uncharacterized protein GSTUM_00001106001 [Tuber melanosporum]CAZ82732.1 unnamed protein product [Tuber melanosporum]